MNRERPQEGPRGQVQRLRPLRGALPHALRVSSVAPRPDFQTQSPRYSCASHFYKMVLKWTSLPTRRDPAPASCGLRFPLQATPLQEATPARSVKVRRGCPSRRGLPGTPSPRGFRRRSVSSSLSPHRLAPIAPAVLAAGAEEPVPSTHLPPPPPHPCLLLGKGRGTWKTFWFPPLRAAGFRFHFLCASGSSPGAGRHGAAGGVRSPPSAARRLGSPPLGRPARLGPGTLQFLLAISGARPPAGNAG